MASSCPRCRARTLRDVDGSVPVSDGGGVTGEVVGFKRCLHCGHTFEPYEIDDDDTARISRVVTIELELAGEPPPELLERLRAASLQVLGSRLRSIEITRTEPRHRARGKAPHAAATPGAP